MRKSYIISFVGWAMLFTTCSTKKQKDESDYFNQAESDSLRVTLTEVWATDSTQFITPECVTYDRGRNVLYVSNINRDNETENDGSISVVNADGSINNATLTEGLASPLGNDARILPNGICSMD